LALSTAELDLISNGFAMINLGSLSATGKVTVAAYTFNDHVSLRSAGASSSGIEFPGAVSVGSNNLTLNTTGNVTQASGASITAAGLQLLGTAGNYTLTDTANAITTLAGSTGNVYFLENSGFAIGTVGTVTSSVGMTTTGNLRLSSTGTVTQSNLISAIGLELLGAGGTYTLTNTSNAITTLAGSTGTVSFLDNNSGFAIGAVNTVGLTASTSLTLNSTGSVTQSQKIDTPSLELLGVGGNYTLTDTANAITTLAGSTGTVSFLENSGYAIGSVNSSTGLTTSSNLTLSTTASVTQSEKIAALGLKLLGTNGSYTLSNSGNAITTLAANTGVISFLENSGYTVGTVLGVDGLTTSGNLALSSSGGITMTKNAVSNAGTQTYTGPITLASQAISLTSTDQAITFYGSTTTINGYQDLTINAGAGDVSFNGIVGGTTHPGTLTVTSSTAINLNADITAASQIYNGPVVIGNDISLIAMGVAATVTYNTASLTNIAVGGYLNSMPVSFTLTGAAGGTGGTGYRDDKYSYGVISWSTSSVSGAAGGVSGTYQLSLDLATGTVLQIAPGAYGVNGSGRPAQQSTVVASGGAAGTNAISGSGVAGADTGNRRS
ncbi:MAG: hypothetical protein JZU60_02925, partial [Ilumatobacteraceae bacterium]|nr:hypothetical protein [Ilumatobacteraceae bacterium]